MARRVATICSLEREPQRRRAMLRVPQLYKELSNVHLKKKRITFRYWRSRGFSEHGGPRTAEDVVIITFIYRS